eukprot:11027-Heterococcus_DN1.PRE.2
MLALYFDVVHVSARSTSVMRYPRLPPNAPLRYHNKEHDMSAEVAVDKRGHKKTTDKLANNMAIFKDAAA